MPSAFVNADRTSGWWTPPSYFFPVSARLLAAGNKTETWALAQLDRLVARARPTCHCISTGLALRSERPLAAGAAVKLWVQVPNCAILKLRGTVVSSGP